MLIDWFTVGAQTLNFLILVALLKRFLYQPILRTIDARETGIAATLAQAAAKMAEAQQERDAFQHKNEELDQRRAALLSAATEEVKNTRQRLLEEARRAAASLGDKLQDTLIQDAHHLAQSIRHSARDEVFAIARKALNDLATTSLEERMTEVFTHRLREMDVTTQASLGAALKATAEPALLRSAFALSVGQQTNIQTALNEIFAIEVRLRFDTAPDLVSGIELSAQGQKIVWSIAGYLSALGESVDKIIEQRARAQAKSVVQDLSHTVALQTETAHQ